MTGNEFQEDWHNLKKTMKTEDENPKYLRHNRAFLLIVQNETRRVRRSPEVPAADFHPKAQVQTAEGT